MQKNKFKKNKVKKPKQEDEISPDKWDETPYITKLLKLDEPKNTNVALNKTIAHVLNLLTNKFTKPLRINKDEVDKIEHNSIWDNVMFILFYGYYNRMAVSKTNTDIYYMRNSNIEVSIPDNIITTYFNKTPEFIIYNMCKSGLHPFNKKLTTIFPVVNEIPSHIMNKYTEYPIYDIAVKINSTKIK